MPKPPKPTKGTPMLRLAIRVFVETLIGLSVAAVVLAISLPVMIGRHLITPGDLTGSVLITSVLVCAIGGMLFRPGSAINRYGQRDG